MKITTFNLFRPAAAGLCMGLWTSLASAQSGASYNGTFNENAAVPQGDPDGLAMTADITDIVGMITGVTVSLDISGGFNGDLYAYLSGPNGGFAVLLNRVGVGSANSFGYADTGFNVVFDDSASDSNSNIHDYQNDPYLLNGGGQLTGVWSSDGRNLDPLSAPSLFDSTAPTATLNSFIGTDPNGTWTLFVADLTSGSQSTVASWGLSIDTTPEPSTGALFAAGFVALTLKIFRRGR